jgi:hypothetical protein
MRVLHDAIRPPLGFELEHLVVTTFTLDLVSLLSVPLAFTWFGTHGDTDAAEREPLELLAAVARSAQRITVFHQGGQVSVPAKHGGLLSLIEDSVVAVPGARVRALFHPKLWVAAYAGNDDSRRYRVLCLSRNLTPDRSWDTILTLEGTATDKAQSASEPLADLLSWLADTPTLARERVQILREVAEGVSRALFTPPEPFTELRFHPVGIPGYRTHPILPARRDRLLIVSPFIGSDQLLALAKGTSETLLVSRPEALGRLGGSLPSGVTKAFRLDEALDPEPEDAETPLLSGLHAKLYVADQGWYATTWTGSANATDAAFGANVEFMTELTGPKGKCGVDALLGDGSADTLRAMLVECAELPSLSLDDETEQALDALARQIADWPLAVHVAEESDSFRLGLAWNGLPPARPNADVTMRPVAWSKPPCQLNSGADLPVFVGLRTHEVSSLFVVEISLPTAPSTSRRFVASWPLVGAVPDRVKALLQELARDRDRVLAFIRMFLAFDDSAPIGAAPAVADGQTGSWRTGSQGDTPILELLLQALTREPARLVELSQWMPDLASRADSDGGNDDLMLIWEPVWQAHQEIHG